MATINAAAASQIKGQIDAAVGGENGLPGIHYYAVNKNGEFVFEHAAGKTGVGRETDLGPHSVFWMASCTKLVTTMACMQLVEQGKLVLDDVEAVEKLAPELRDVKVLDESGQLVEKKKGITLRMLLTHTSGFGYSFFHKRLAEYLGPAGLIEVSGRKEDYLEQPLVNQPGEMFDYGIGMDWVGVLIMRATNMSLEEYFRTYITGPLGVADDISFLPNEQMRRDLVWMHTRDPSGKLRLRDDGHLFRAPLRIRTAEDQKALFQSGGAGTWARPRAYGQIIATLLNDGVHAPSGTRILKAETIEQMFTNQIPDMPNFARGMRPWVKPDYTNVSPEFYPEPDNPPQGWGLSFFLHLQDSMIHSKGTGWWCGLANIFWWCDRAKGIGGMVSSQILPFGDLPTVGLWAGVEGALYQSLEQP